MITTSEIGKLVYDRCRDFNVPLYLTKTTPVSAIEEERIVVIVKPVFHGRIWHRAYVEVNWCVPNFHNEANLVRLEEVERLLEPLKYQCGQYNGNTYRWNFESLGTVDEDAANYNFVNLKLLFNIQNVN